MNLVNLGKLAKGVDVEPGEPPAAEEDAVEEVVESKRYRWPVRFGLDAVIEVPADLTEQEAERLALFVRSLGLPPTALESVSS